MIDIHVDKDLCKGCNICIRFCPKGIFTKSNCRNANGMPLPGFSRTEQCVCCRLCERLCPDGAISVRKSGAGKTAERGAA